MAQDERPLESNAGDAPVKRANYEDIEAASPRNDKHKVENAELAGVKLAAATEWKKRDIIIIYTGLFLMNFVVYLDTSTVATITPLVLSQFDALSKGGGMSSISYLAIAALKPAFSKLADAFGRAEAYCVALAFHTLAYVISAAAQSFGMYFAANVLVSVGQTGFSVILYIVIADIIPLLSRGSFQSYLSIPSLTNAYLGPVIATALVASSWRWVFILLNILGVICSIPIMYVLFAVQSRAKKKLKAETEMYESIEEVPTKPLSIQSLRQRFVRIMTELDVVGVVLLIGGTIMILGPISLGFPAHYGWNSAMVLGLIISGVVCLIIFLMYEIYVSVYPVLPLRLLANRNVGGGLISVIIYYCSTNLTLYFINAFLQVTRDADMQEASMLQLGFTAGATVGQIVAGWLMQWSGRYRRWMWLAYSLLTLGTGLMIRLKGADITAAEIGIVQAVTGIGGGALYCTTLIGVQAAVEPADVAIATTFFAFMSFYGGAIGEAASSAFWTYLLPRKLEGNLLPGMDIAKIINDVTYIKSLTPAQNAIVKQAYIETQRDVSITGTIILGVGSIGLLFMKGYDLRQKTKN
ncbi:uncharacterized protein VTP21DRAFT_1679 [Calcarisporiella thermophila]|uniref:uncharacterized protein n=1 Tax=Calcarisporiella thermophila TaxID=911321 RepID=UPI003742E251